MADNPNPPVQGLGLKLAPGSSELAPFIYTDGVATYGVANGIVQMELAANAIMPEGTGTRTDVYITAHLRCSVKAAIALRDAINRMLDMAVMDQTIEPIPASKPN